MRYLLKKLHSSVAIVILLLFFGFYESVAENAFITRWNTANLGTSTSNDHQVIFPGVGTYQIAWKEISNPTNSGTVNGAGVTTITFPSVGAYELHVTGALTALQYSMSNDYQKLTSIEQWGDIGWTTMASAFKDCSNMKLNATDAPDLSNVQDMSSMFYECGSLEATSSFNNWDVSNVTNMNFLFSGASMNSSLSNWDVSNVLYMVGMFAGTSNFQQDLSMWDVSSVVDFSNMFFSSEYNQPLNDWDVSSAVDMHAMFSFANQFNQPLNNWDVSSVTDMRYMFGTARKFNQSLNDWNTSSVTTMEGMFNAAYEFNSSLSNWDVSNVTTMENMFYLAKAFNQNLGTWNISKVTSMEGMFFYTPMSVENYDQTLILWNGQTVQPDVILAASGLKYCDANSARSNLISTNNWVIYGDAYDCGATGIEDAVAENKLRCFPNPINTAFDKTIVVNGIAGGKATASICEITGIEIYSAPVRFQHDQGEVPVEKLPAGTYVLKVISDEKVYTSLIQVQ